MPCAFSSAVACASFLRAVALEQVLQRRRRASWCRSSSPRRPPCAAGRRSRAARRRACACAALARGRRRDRGELVGRLVDRVRALGQPRGDLRRRRVRPGLVGDVAERLLQLRASPAASCLPYSALLVGSSSWPAAVVASAAAGGDERDDEREQRRGGGACRRSSQIRRRRVPFRAMALDPTHTALGTWSGGRFMHFGAPLDDDRYLALIRPDERVRTVLTADVYGEGEADTLLGRALDGLDRDAYCLVGAVGHDFYDGEREGAEGLPALHRPAAARPRASTRPTCGPPPSARCSASAPTASTCCCCTTRTAPATRSPRSGRAWPRCATPASRACSASRPARPTASRSTSSTASSASAS